MAEIVELQENGVPQYLKTHAKAVVDAYAVGDIHLSTSSTNPSARFGGTWERFGKGRTLVGVDEGDSALSTPSKTGGSTNPLSEHNHQLRMLQNGASAQTASTGVKYGLQFSDDKFWRIGDLALCDETNNSGPSGQTGGIAKTKGNNAGHANWQPFITVYMWVKTA